MKCITVYNLYKIPEGTYEAPVLHEDDLQGSLSDSTAALSPERKRSPEEIYTGYALSNVYCGSPFRVSGTEGQKL